MSAPKKKPKPKAQATLEGTKTGPVFVPLSLHITPCPSCSARVVQVEVEHFSEDGHQAELVTATIESGGELAFDEDGEPGIWRQRHSCNAPMPRLSLDLVHQRHPGYCQACGHRGEAARHLVRWEEHDEQDRRDELLQRRIVVLCQACAKKVIDPHLRLYREMELYEAHPGSMDICARCVHRRGLSCHKVKAGVPPTLRQKASPVFLDYTKGGRRAGHMEMMHFEWPECSERREEVPAPPDTPALPSPSTCEPAAPPAAPARPAPRLRCRSCEATIHFVVTRDGHSTPCNEDGSPHWATCTEPERFRRRPRRIEEGTNP